MCCGVGPCAQLPKMKKESDQLLVGTGDSQLAGGCCKGLMHNAGDKMIISSDEHGPKAIFHAGNSPFYPPCLQGKDVVKMKKSGGGPSNAEMQR